MNEKQPEQCDGRLTGSSPSNHESTNPEVELLKLRDTLKKVWACIKTPEFQGPAMAISTVIMALFTGATWWTIFIGSRDTRNAASAAMKAADAAWNNAELTRQQLIGTEAAILNIRFDVFYQVGSETESQGLRSIIEYIAGHVIATDIHASFDVSRKREPDFKDIGTPQHFDVDFPQLMSPQLMPGPSPYGVKGYDVTWLTPEVWDILKHTSKEQTISVTGEFRYDNGFRQIINKPICSIWFAHLPMQNVSDGNWVDCAAYPAKLKYWAQLEKQELNKNRGQ
jgi:hypothetical protein